MRLRKVYRSSKDGWWHRPGTGPSQGDQISPPPIHWCNNNNNNNNNTLFAFPITNGIALRKEKKKRRKTSTKYKRKCSEIDLFLIPVSRLIYFVMQKLRKWSNLFFLQMKASMLLKRNTILWWAFKESKSEYLLIISSFKDFLIVLYLLQDTRKCPSFSTSFELQYWQILRCSGSLGVGCRKTQKRDRVQWKNNSASM